MNKISYLLLLALIICYIKCDASECDGETGNNADECNALKKSSDYYKCCFAEYSGGKSCVSVTEAQYDDIDEFIDNAEDDGGIKDLEIDCGSKYIIFSLLSLIIILL